MPRPARTLTTIAGGLLPSAIPPIHPEAARLAREFAAYAEHVEWRWRVLTSHEVRTTLEAFRERAAAIDSDFPDDVVRPLWSTLLVQLDRLPDAVPDDMASELQLHRLVPGLHRVRAVLNAARGELADRRWRPSVSAPSA